MRYEIRSDEKVPLKICEDDETTGVIRNVALLLSTRQGTIPMYRDFGLPMAWVHRPLAAARALAVNEVVEALARFEPRATLVDLRLEFLKKEIGAYVLIVEVDI